MIPFYHGLRDKSSGQIAQSFELKNVQIVQKSQILFAGTRWRTGKKSEGLRPHDFTGVDIVAIAIFIQPLGGLVCQVCVFRNKSPYVATGCRTVQTTHTKHTIFDGGDDGLIGLESNTALNIDDFAICVGVIGKLSSHIFSPCVLGAPPL
jgi:hypothetical protein